MKTLKKEVFHYLETKSGLILLGFVVTTVGGSFLNYQIQSKQAENNQTFEMYKTRLAEAKKLQEELLTASAERSFYLNQALVKLAHPQQNPSRDVENYWRKHVSPSKDYWNRKLFFLHAQVRTLFSPALANLLLVRDETQSFMDDDVLDKLDPNIYNSMIPRSLHGAFVHTHATAYHLLKKCNGTSKAQREELINLAEKQMEYLEKIQSCVMYRISSELLRYPYGPQSQLQIDMPEACAKLGPQPAIIKR